MKDSIRHQIIGQKIVKVTYFELNDLDHAVYFDTFDNFDLGIEIAFSNGFHWHIGWTDNDYHEAGEGNYIPTDRLYPHKQIDATNRWTNYLNSTISNFEVIFVTEQWNIPAKCTIQFNHSESISIILGEELNSDESLPQPLEFVEANEIYVLFPHSNELPLTEIVEVILHKKPAGKVDKNHALDESLHPDSVLKAKSINLVGLLIIFVITALIIIKLTLDK